MIKKKMSCISSKEMSMEVKITALSGKNVFGIHLKMNAFLNLKASFHYTKYIYNETIFQFTTKG